MKSRFALRFLVDALGKLAMFVLTVFLARALGVEDFGKLAFAMAFVNVAYQLSESGMSLVFLREMGRVSQGNAAAHASAVWSEFFGLRLSLCLAVGAVGAAASFWVWPWEEPWILVAVLGWILGNSFVDFFHQVCNGAGDIRTSARIMALHRGLTLVLPVAFAVAGSGLSGVSVGMALGSLSGAALALAVVHRTFGYPFRPVWQPRVWAARLKTVLPLAVANLFGSVYVRLGILMLPWLGYNHEVGFFSAAHKLFEAGYLIPLAFVTIAIPHLSGLHHRDPVAFRREARKQFLFILGLACLWLAGGELLAGTVVKIFFGPDYEPSVAFLRVLVAAGFLVFINYFITSLMVVLGRLKLHAFNEAASLAAGAVATYWLASSHGGMGASWALVTAEAVLMVLTLFSLRSDGDADVRPAPFSEVPPA